MRILFIVDDVPHSGAAGGYQIVFQRLRRLVERGHEVGVACFCDPGKQQLADDLRRIARWVRLIPRPCVQSHAILARVLRYRRPWWFARAYSPRMEKVVGDMVEELEFPVAVAEFSVMGQYFLLNRYLPAVRRVISCHSSPWFGCLRALKVHRPGSYAWSALVCRMAGMKRFEFTVYRNADWIITLSPDERYWLLTMAPGLDISIVPPGVDTARFLPRPPEKTEKAVMFMGRFGDETNVDAVLWFVSSVWPRIVSRQPEIRFYVVGPEPPPPVRALVKADSRIVVTGRVADVRPYLERARVFVCPVRFGCGLRTKVLDAMAGGLPVVSTMLGMEGIPAEPGGNCFIADKPDMMAAYVNLLLNDLDLNREIGLSAHRTMQQHFDWEKLLDSLESVLRRLVPVETGDFRA